MHRAFQDSGAVQIVEQTCIFVLHYSFVNGGLYLQQISNPKSNKLYNNKSKYKETAWGLNNKSPEACNPSVEMQNKREQPPKTTQITSRISVCLTQSPAFPAQQPAKCWLLSALGFTRLSQGGNEWNAETMNRYIPFFPCTVCFKLYVSFCQTKELNGENNNLVDNNNLLGSNNLVSYSHILKISSLHDDYSHNFKLLQKCPPSHSEMLSIL